MIVLDDSETEPNEMIDLSKEGEEEFSREEAPILAFYSMEQRRYELMRTLDEVKPMFVILYNANLETIRQVEVR